MSFKKNGNVILNEQTLTEIFNTTFVNTAIDPGIASTEDLIQNEAVSNKLLKGNEVLKSQQH